MPKNTWICPLCTDDEGMPMEFENSRQYEEHNKSVHTGVEAKVKKPKPPIQERQKVEIAPETQTAKIVLTYKFIGQCPNCGKDVDTLTLDVGEEIKEHFCIAWCNACKEKRAERKVTKL